MTASSLGFRPAATGGIAGSLSLTVARRGNRTGPVRTDSVGLLRLLKPLYLDDSGQVTYIVVNPGGGYFGETYRLEVDVQPGAGLLLSSQGATRIHRTPGVPAVQQAVFTVGDGSRMEYVPDQTIAYRNADYRQSTTVTVAPGAQAFLGEIVTPGWDPDGAPFTYAGMRLRIDVLRDRGGLVCTDNVRLDPAVIGPAFDGIGYLEGASHLGSVLVLGAHTQGSYVHAVRSVVEDSGLAKVGVTTGSRHGISWLMVRALAPSTDALNALILALNQLDRSLTTGQARLNLRRY